MNELSPAAIHYCYKCGRRLTPGVDACWYCGAKTLRPIRPPRRCPFCQEVVRPGAVKCPHCAEFLDGRERPQVSQVVFVVDGRMLQGRAGQGDLRLSAGSRVPPEIAAALSPRTVEAIETNRPALIEDRGVRALPPPAGEGGPLTRAGGSVSDAEGIDAGGGAEGAARLPVRSSGTGLMRARELEAPPERPLPPILRAGLAVGSALGRLIKRPVPPPAAREGVRDAEVDTRYRVCEQCQTEILAADNYCFHCGFQYHKPTPTEVHGVRPAPPRRSVALLYLAAIVLNIGVAAAPFVTGLIALPPLTREALAALAVLLLVTAFVRRRGFMNQALAVILIVASAGVYFSKLVL